jgi:hypothetical protein
LPEIEAATGRIHFCKMNEKREQHMNQFTTATSPLPTVAKLEIFISYASEDVALALALNKELSEYLDSDFSHVWIDIEGIRAGFELNDQIKVQLDKTDVLIVVYTGQHKESHGFTGLEIGYFMKAQSGPVGRVQRRIVSMFSGTPPGPTSAIRGVPFGIDDSQLAMTEKEYEDSLNTTVTARHPTSLFLEDLEQDVDEFRIAIGLKPLDNKLEVRLERVRQLMLAMFKVFKTRKYNEVNPQKKIIVSVGGELSPQSEELPGTSMIVPEGTGMMSIFGLPDQKISWAEFLSKAPDKYRLFWKDTIEFVILSSLDRLDADNSQIIISEKDQTIYRVILSKRTKYYNGIQEFHLYFVEILRRHDFGDEHSTNLLKALGLCCRFRFLFFEKRSEFSSNNFSVQNDANAREKARRLLKELNLIRRDSMEAQLDDPAAWAELLEDWKLIAALNSSYGPIEEDLRRAASVLLAAKAGAETHEAREALIKVIQSLESDFDQKNAKIIGLLAKRLGSVSGSDLDG